MDRRREAGTIKAQLSNVRALPSGPPRTKTGQVLWAWPAIQLSLNSGRNLREIWEALQLDGIEMSYDQFRVYVSRIRKRLAEQPPTMPAPQVAELRVAEGRDPLANIRREQDRKQRAGFDFGGLSRETE
jgi:hypothetical protein